MINVVFIADSNYIVPTSVALYSIIANMSETDRLTIHIVTTDNNELLNTYFSLFTSDRVMINVHFCELGELEQLHKPADGTMCVATPAALLKFCLPRILNDCEKVLYLDGDLIVQDSLGPLFSMDISNVYLAAVEDSGTLYSGRKTVRESLYYFNSGVMLLNLKKMREDNLAEKLIEAKSNSSEHTLMDQDVFNEICEGAVCRLPIKYNFLYINLYRARNKYSIEQLNQKYKTNYFNIQDGCKSAIILHYASKDKPWKNHYAPLSRKWFKLLRMLMDQYGEHLSKRCSVYYDEIIKVSEKYPLTIPDMVVSMTTFPERIGTVSNVVIDMLNQAEIPDKIQLWIAEDQFESISLPEELLTLCKYGLEIKYCDNIYSHKKYYYAIQENSDSVVVTVDDDIKYDSEITFDLWNSYIRHPSAISASRVHAMRFDEEGQLMPYMSWEQEVSSVYQEPSINLFSTSGAGTLFPPNSMSSLLFDKEMMMDICGRADDVWLKFMQVLNNTPVVLARPSKKLILIEGTQVPQSLCRQNRTRGGNDIQIAKVINYVSQREDSVLDQLCKGYDEIKNIVRNPIVSVLISSFDAKDEIRKCLDSILAQTLHDIEVICINDGCKQKILLEYANLDERVNVIFSKKKKTFQELLNIVKGKYVLIANPNNRYSPDFLYEAYKNVGLYNVDVVSTLSAFEDNIGNVRRMYKHVGSMLPKNIPFISLDRTKEWFGSHTTYYDDKLFKKESVEAYFRNSDSYLASIEKFLFNVKQVCIDYVGVSIGQRALLNKNYEEYITKYKGYISLFHYYKTKECWNEIGTLFYSWLAKEIRKDLYMTDYTIYEKVFMYISTHIINDFELENEVDSNHEDICALLHIINIMGINSHVHSYREDEYEELLKKYNALVLRNNDMNRELAEVSQGKEELLVNLNDLSYRLSETRKSFSYKLGLFITIIPRKIRGIINKNKK